MPAKHGKALLGLLFSALFGYLFATQVDWPQLRQALAGASPALIGCGLVALSADYAIRGLRWHTMLRRFNPALPLRRCWTPLLGSYALNNLLPFRLGDVARVTAFRNTLGITASDITGTLIVERILDLCALLSILGATIALNPALFGGGTAAALIWPSLLAAAVGLLAVILLPGTSLRLLRRLNAWPAFAPARPAVDFLERVTQALLSLRTASTYARLFSLSLLCWALESIVFLAAATAVGAASGPIGAAFATAIGTLGTLLPSTPGYLGTFDYLTAWAFRQAGAQSAIAALAALTTHLLLWLPITAAGGALLLRSWGTLHLFHQTKRSARADVSH